MAKAGAVLGHGHRYAHKLSMLTPWGSNTDADRTEPGRAQQTWSDAREALRSTRPNWTIARVLTETDQIRDRARTRYLEQTRGSTPTRANPRPDERRDERKPRSQSSDTRQEQR
ncbi:MAG: hypothetical protein GEV07_11065 [Streptosporangiales bacterium]|nr:hypothetical protein [Streptosporangiales bacterium]